MKTTFRLFLSLSSLGWLAACQPEPALLGETLPSTGSEAASPLTAQAARIPRVTSVVPPLASNLGSAILTLNGRSFDAGTQVFVAGQPVLYTSLLSSTQLSVQLPRAVYAPGPVSVKVVNADGRTSERSDVLTLFADTTALAGQRVPSSGGTMGPGLDVVATGDLSGDGLIDLVAQDYSRLYVQIAKGRGSYSDPQSLDLPTFGMPVQVEIGDVNGDGKLDVVAGAGYGLTVAAFLNRGSGSLGPAVASSLSGVGSPYGSTLADVNKDGRADLVLVLSGSPTLMTPYSLAVFLVGSDGRFASMGLYTGLNDAGRPLLRDVNGDGHVDLLLASVFNSQVGVLMGDSSGKFAAPVVVAVDSVPREVALADINGDAKLDLVTLGSDGKVSLRSGKGDGSFSGTAMLTVAAAASTLAVADATGDGRADLVVGHDRSYLSTGTVPGGAWLLAGKGDATFQTPQELNLFPLWGAKKLRIADADKDGKADLLVNGESSHLVIYGRGGGQFIEDRQFPSAATAIASADLNGDGKADIVSAAVGANKVYVALNNGDGTTAAPRAYDTDRGPSAVALADVTGDGKLDLLVANYDSGSFSLLPGNGDGSFQPQRVFPVVVGATALVVADMNGDTRPDVVTASYESNNVSVLLNSGSGSFAAAKSYSTGAGPAALVADDFNKDGRMDVVTANLDGNNLSYLQGSGTTAGALNVARSLSAGRGPVAVIARDVTGDGNVDLLVGNSDSGDVSRLSGRGDGSFVAATVLAGGVGRVTDLALADLSKDGRLDLVVSTLSGGTGSTRLFYGFAGGVFAPAAQSLDVGGPVAVADLAGDSKLDLLIARASGLVMLFTNVTQ